MYPTRNWLSGIRQLFRSSAQASLTEQSAKTLSPSAPPEYNFEALLNSAIATPISYKPKATRTPHKSTPKKSIKQTPKKPLQSIPKKASKPTKTTSKKSSPPVAKKASKSTAGKRRHG